VVDGTEGPGSFDELNELVVASLQPLQTVGGSKSGADGEGVARGIKVEDMSRRRRDRGGGGGGEKVCGSDGDQRRQRRANIGGRDTRCSGGETEKGERKTKTKEGMRGGDVSGCGGGKCGINLDPTRDGDQRRQGRANIGGRDTRCSGGETEKGEKKTKTKEGMRGGDVSGCGGGSVGRRELRWWG
jgi:hypothetical protein